MKTGDLIHNLGGGMVVETIIFDNKKNGLVVAKHEECPSLKMLVDVNIWNGELYAI